MTTVDDLTISLTIKDNSNLDKLRKNVEAIMKTGVVGGAGAGATTRMRTQLDVKFKEVLREIDYLKNYVVPVQTPSELKGLGAVAGGMISHFTLEGMKDKIATILRGKKGGIENIIDRYKLEGPEDVEPFLLRTVDDMIQDLLEVNLEQKNIKKAHQMVNLMKRVLANLKEDQGEGRTLLTAYMKIRDEEKKRMNEYLTKVMGDDKHFIGELRMARLQEGAFANKAELLVELGKKMGEIDTEKLAEIEGFFDGIPNLPTLEEAFKKLNLDFDKDLFDKNEIGKSEELRAIALVWLKRLLDEEWDPDKVTGAMGGYISHLNKEFKGVLDKPLFMFAKRLDYLLLGEKGPEALEQLGFKNISDALLQTLESKGTISDLFKEKDFYEPIAGKVINVIGNQISEAFTDSIKVNTAILERADMLDTIGKTLEINDARREKLQQELIKVVSEMGVTKKLTGGIDELVLLLKKLQGETGEIDISKAENRALYNKVMELIDQFGSTSGIF